MAVLGHIAPHRIRAESASLVYILPDFFTFISLFRSHRKRTKNIHTYVSHLSGVDRSYRSKLN